MGKTKCIRNVRCELCNVNGMLQIHLNQDSYIIDRPWNTYRVF